MFINLLLFQGPGPKKSFGTSKIFWETSKNTPPCVDKSAYYAGLLAAASPSSVASPRHPFARRGAADPARGWCASRFPAQPHGPLLTHAGVAAAAAPVTAPTLPRGPLLACAGAPHPGFEARRRGAGSQLVLLVSYAQRTMAARQVALLAALVRLCSVQ